ncbi:MAG TPA: hypothetical protein VK891_05875 [Euzebyales bacterium]|nr:hypothetical protein [Euzebyales bacterium]
MAHSAQREATRSARARARWPYVGQPQLLLAITAPITLIASFLPWLDTALLGPVNGATAGGLFTCYAALLAIAGVIWRSPRVVAGHLLVLAVTNIAVPGWRFVWALGRLPGFGEAWLPGIGMLLVVTSGAVAAYGLVRLWIESIRGPGATGVPGRNGTTGVRERGTAGGG